MFQHSLHLAGSQGMHSRVCHAPMRLAASMLLLFILAAPALQAQGSMSLSTGNTANNGLSGTTFLSFDITATQPVNIHRLASTFYTGTGTVEIWAKPGGIVANDNTGWVFLNSATVTSTSTTTEEIIPVTLNYMINTNQKVGFAIVSTIGSRYTSGATPYQFSDSWMTIDTYNGWSGSATTNPTAGTVSFTWTNNPRELAGTVYYDAGIIGPDDAAISELLSPVSFCAGENDVKVKLMNLGTNPLTSATINWSLNGVPQTPIAWTGNLASAASTDVTLGTKPFASNVSYPLVVFSSQPNGMTDTRSSNDTLTATLKAALSGAMTIGGSGADFASFSDAVAELNANGICGPVVFDVRPGTYNEQVSLGSITGASATNTIIFRSETGVRTDVTLTHASSGSTDNYVLQLAGAQYVTFRDMTIIATGTSYGTALDIRGGTSFSLLESLDLVGVSTTSSTSTNLAVVYSPSGSIDPDNTFRNCNVTAGSYGMYLYGSGSSNTEDNVTVQGCRFTGQWYRPVHVYYLGQFSFLDNHVEFTSAYGTKYTAYLHYGYNTRIERNTFITTGGNYSYGVYFYYDNYYQTGSSRFVNNFISSSGSTSTSYGVRPYNCKDLLFAHNTVVMDNNYATSYAVYNYSGENLRYLNNIMMHTGAGRAFYVGTASAILESDYNDIYAAGPVLAYWGGNQATLVDLQTASGMDLNSVSKAPSFADVTNGDLHLVAPSDDDADLIGTLLPEVTEDIDGDPRVRPYRGADEACYVIPGSLSYTFVDNGGNPTGYAMVPGTVDVKYRVSFPDEDANVTMTVNFYGLDDNLLKHSTSFVVYKQAGQTLNGTERITLPGSLPLGFCRVEVVFNTKNSCGSYRDYMPYASALMLIEQGNVPCEVWPGDVNNDGLVNYSDRKDLNVYIHDANLRTLWLNGPARYRADAAQNPLTFLAWEPQAGVPWHTPEGCYMDADGNGVVNNFDYIAIKINWLRSHGAISPKQDRFNALTFDMSQNFPNPFNPTTSILYSVPERSRVQLRIVSMLGEEIELPVDGIVEAGAYEYMFDAAQLPSGQYLAIVSMTGLESGLGFQKTVKMLLAK